MKSAISKSQRRRARKLALRQQRKRERLQVQRVTDRLLAQNVHTCLVNNGTRVLHLQYDGEDILLQPGAYFTLSHALR